jgi:hypothetical protein
MLTPKEIELIARIREKTLHEGLQWIETGNADSFQVSFPDSSIIILLRTGNNGEDIVFQILNSSGEIIREIDDAEISEQLSGGYNYMKEIWSQARSVALNVDRTIDNILKEL